MQITGGRSVYSEDDLDNWARKAKAGRPVKVINFLLVAYIDPPVSKDKLETMGVINGHPQQSIYKLRHHLIASLVSRSNLHFEI